MKSKESPEKKDEDVNFIIDLRKLQSDGDFPCPKCGAIISPDDKSEEVYGELQTVMKGAQLEAILLSCEKCGSRIKLIGFKGLL